MSDEKLIRIFDHNTCLTPRQVKGYVSGSMVHEESHAIEAHLLNCPLCTEAVEGVREHRINGGVDGMMALTPDFLEGHSGFKIDDIPQTPLSIPKAKIKSSLSSTKGNNGEQKKIGSPQLWRTVSIAATVLLAGGLFWFIQKNRDSLSDTKVAQNVPIENNVVQEPVTAAPVLVAADSSDVMDTSSQSVVDNQPVVNDTAITPLTSTESVNVAAKKIQEDKTKELVAKKDADKKKVADANKPVSTIKRQAAPVNNASGGVGTTNNYSSNAVDAADDISKTPTRNAAPVVQASPPPPKPATADELYDQKKYSQALAKYKQEMNSSDGKDKEDAKLGVAKCYIALGEKKQAERLLRGMLYENSKRKRQAKKLLKTIEED